MEGTTLETMRLTAPPEEDPAHEDFVSHPERSRGQSPGTAGIIAKLRDRARARPTRESYILPVVTLGGVVVDTFQWRDA